MFKDAVRHISFDVWNTLFIPNPAFSEARTQLIAETFNISFEDAAKAYTAVKKQMVWINERHGRVLDCYQEWEYLARYELYNKDVDIFALQKTANELFSEIPPNFVPEVRDILQTVDRCTFSIVSNTNFFSGVEVSSTLREIFGIEWESQAYSDLVRVAKPHPRIFEKMFYSIPLEKMEWIHSKDNVVHIGDSQHCDVDGAARAGIRGRLLRKPEDLPDLLRSLLKGE